MALVTPQAESRFVVHGDWQTYEKLLEALEDRGVRIAYDRGTIELMTPSHPHERGKKTLAALLEMYLVECGLDFQGGGSTTFREEALDKGIEPDECYWIRNAAELEGDWTGPDDPYPDLAIEVELSRSALNRLGIFAALGVAEVWRLTAGLELQCHRLEDGSYWLASSSALLPDLPWAELQRFVRKGQEQTLGSVLREFREWLRTRAG